MILKEIDEGVARSLVPHREAVGNKGSFGKTLLLVGSDKYRGAMLLCRQKYRLGDMRQKLIGISLRYRNGSNDSLGQQFKKRQRARYPLEDGKRHGTYLTNTFTKRKDHV